MEPLCNVPEFLLSYDRNFVILKAKNKISDDEYYIIYNSVQHVVAKLNKIEFILLDSLYKYEDPDYLSSMLDERFRSSVHELLTKETVSKLLSTKASPDSFCKKEENLIPSTYYLHLTDHCNLKCTYCYNQAQRSNKEDMPFYKWEKILDKILPHADHIILTGGECFLYKNIGKIIEYIKKNKKSVCLSCISNGMHDFAQLSSDINFSKFDSIMFSCDSLDREGMRSGFNPNLFDKSIKFFTENFPDISLSISATRTVDNSKDLEKIRDFCNLNKIPFKFVNLIPERIEDIQNMPNAISCIYQCDHLIEKSDTTVLPAKNIRCGAGFGVLSISSKGDVYPCQALHYKEFLMGNILEKDIKDLNYIKDHMPCLPGVDDIEGCRICNLRYLCGGGCLAVSYPSNRFKFKRNRLICPYNYENAMSILIKIGNSLKKEKS